MGEARAPAGKVEILPPEGRTKGGATRSRVRRDGWTPRRRQLFLEAVARQATMQEAARSVDMSMTSVRNLRKRDPEFDRACEAALATMRPSLFETAYQRAVFGAEEPVFQGGKQVGTRRKPSDAMLRLLIDRGYDPNQAPASVPTTVTRPGYATQEEVDAALMAQLDALSRRLQRDARRQQLSWADAMQAEGWAP
jgi:hypothetical protein